MSERCGAERNIQARTAGRKANAEGKREKVKVNRIQGQRQAGRPLVITLAAVELEALRSEATNDRVYVNGQLNSNPGWSFGPLTCVRLLLPPSPAQLVTIKSFQLDITDNYLRSGRDSQRHVIVYPHSSGVPAIPGFSLFRSTSP